MIRTWTGALVGVMLAVGFYAEVAHADITASLPTITPSGGDYQWSYTLDINAFEHINTAVNPSLFTLYDVSGLVGTPVFTPLGTVAGTISVQDLGLTPPTQIPVDNPAIPNITVTFNGTQASSSAIGTLSFLDTDNTSLDGWFSAEASDNNGGPEGNTARVPVPAPEPGTLALITSGLGMIGMAIRRRGRVDPRRGSDMK